MTGIRQSFIFAFEDEFGKGKGTRNWIQPPPGSQFEFTPNRQTTDIYGMGDKFRQNVAYGQFSGTWNWTYMLDYVYLEPLMLAFEKVGGRFYGDADYGKPDANGIFTFEKVNGHKVPSFVTRVKKLNRIVGGNSTKDELTECKGCFVQQISFSRSASSAQYQVNLSGAYVDEQDVVGDLDSLDWKAYTPKLVEYSCLFQGDEVDDDNYVANTESLSLTIGNNANAVYNICTAFANIFYEGNAQFQFNTVMYSWNPEIWRLRANSGGYDNTHMKPMAKNLRPLDDLMVASYNKSMRDYGYNTMTDAFENSDYYVTFHIEGAVIKGVKRPSGDGSKIIDTVSSSNCTRIEIAVKTDAEIESLMTAHNISSDNMSLPRGYTFQIPSGMKTVFVPYSPTNLQPIGHGSILELVTNESVTTASSLKPTDIEGSYSDKLNEMTANCEYVSNDTVLLPTAEGDTATTIGAFYGAPGVINGITLGTSSGSTPCVTISGTPTGAEGDGVSDAVMYFAADLSALPDDTLSVMSGGACYYARDILKFFAIKLKPEEVQPNPEEVQPNE